MKTIKSDTSWVYALIWSIIYICSMLSISKFKMPNEVAYTLIAINAIAFIVYVYKFYKTILFMDEVQIKIQMEAMVIAFALSLILVMKLGLLEVMGLLEQFNWSYTYLLPIFIGFYMLSFFIVKRKYNFEDEKHD